jgi:tetratricopeptide (TPR) repeat protein
MTTMLQNVHLQYLRTCRTKVLLLISTSAICSSLHISSLTLAAQQPRSEKSSRISQKVTRAFQDAVTAYQAERYAEAQRKLRPLLAADPDSFEINELTGLVCVALGQDEKAHMFLAKAARLNPASAAAHTTLAANLVRVHRNTEAEAQFRKVVDLEPQSYDANHNLGEFYIQTHALAQAIPYLKRAQEINPHAYNNGYDLALAYEQTGNLDKARSQVEQLLKINDTAELHSFLAEIEERAKNYLVSAAQFEQAVRMDPSENNILEWGTELLLHQTFEPAGEVFKTGLARYPHSGRLELGLGIALYGLSRFDDGAKAFFQASDMNAADPLPLIFLGKAYENLSPPIREEVRLRLRRFWETQPRNPLIPYYYAMTLWKQSQAQPESTQVAEIETLLKSAVSLDPQNADAYLQLGILYASQHKYNDAITQYEHTLKINPDTAAVHYRLGQALARTGAATRAQQEFSEFERLQAHEVDETQKQTAEIQQFVYSLRNSNVVGKE